MSMQFSRLFRQRLFLWILAILFFSGMFALVSLYIIIHVDIVDSDFFSFWLAGKVVLQGQSPYDEQVWLTGHQVYHADWISDPAFLYPLPLAVLMIPLSLLSLPLAYALWVWLSQWILFFTTLRLLALFEEKRRFFVFPVVAGLLLFRPLFPLLRNGQLATLVLFSILLSAIFFTQRRLFLAGVTLAFAVLKPNLGVPILGLVSLYLLLRKQYRGLIGAVTGLMAILLSGLLIQPDWMGEYIHVLTFKQIHSYGYASSIWGLTYLLTDMNIRGSILLAGLSCLLLLGMFVFWVLSGRVNGDENAFSLAVPLGVLMTPYLWPYDQILLVIPIVTLMALIHKRGVPFLGSALIFLLVDVVYLVILWGSLQIEMEGAGALIPLIVSGALFVLMRKSTISIPSRA